MLSKAEERRILALHRRDQREKHRAFLAEGVRLVEELLAAGLEVEHIVVSPSIEDTERGRTLARRLADVAPLRSVSESELRRLAATETPQGVLVVAAAPGADTASIVLGPSATVLVLDAVQDPGNFGTLVRSADAFGVAAVLALDGTVDPWNAKAVRAAAGSAFRVPIVQLDAADSLDWLASVGARILIADALGDPVRDVVPGGRSALVLGNEGAGVRETIRAAAAGTVAVPVRGAVDSLNVAVAGAILMYELTR